MLAKAVGSRAEVEAAKKAQPRRGSGSGAGHGSASRGAGATRHGEGPADDGGREGKIIPTVGAPDTPSVLRV